MQASTGAGTPSAVAGVLILGVLLFVVAFFCPASVRFRVIYHANLWGSLESRSGRGSTLAATRNIRRILVELLPSVDAFLDAPCGDFHWMKYVREEVKDFDAKYTGLDIVPPLIAANKSAHPSVHFVCGKLEAVTTAYDLLLVRDLLQHLSTPHQLELLRALRRSGSKLLLINFEPEVTENSWARADPAPDWVPFNLLLPPFGMQPLRCFPSDGVDKHYALFDLQTSKGQLWDERR
jgi:hypothetical protein